MPSHDNGSFFVASCAQLFGPIKMRFGDVVTIATGDDTWSRAFRQHYQPYWKGRYDDRGPSRNTISQIDEGQHDDEVLQAPLSVILHFQFCFIFLVCIAVI
jgi:hypothetical protein